MIENDAWVTQAWSDHHGFLLDVGYRLLGSYSEAEDTVQEAFTRLLRTYLDPIQDVRAWLVVLLGRLAWVCDRAGGTAAGRRSVHRRLRGRRPQGFASAAGSFSRRMGRRRWDAGGCQPA